MDTNRMQLVIYDRQFWQKEGIVYGRLVIVLTIRTFIWELSRLLSEDISDEVLIAILGQNAKGLFKF